MTSATWVPSRLILSFSIGWPLGFVTPAGRPSSCTGADLRHGAAVYRQSSTVNEANTKIDAGNQYLWRFNRQRLDAESIRDSIVMAAGKLDLTMGGPAAEQFFFKDDHSPVYDYARFDPDSPANYRRSVYRFLVRSVPDPLMERFDCPDVSLITAKRSTTITAIQALALLNNPFVLKQVEHLAQHARDAGGDPDPQRLPLDVAARSHCRGEAHLAVVLRSGRT